MLKRERITLSMAQAVVAAYRRIPIRQQQVDLEGALEIASRLGLYAYDAYLLCCAMDCGAPLMTLDRALALAARSVGVDLWEVQP